MFKTRPCGCKGLRSCKICENEYGAYQISSSIPKENSYIFCPFCKRLWPGWELCNLGHPDHIRNSEKADFSVGGIQLFLDFITEAEEDRLLKHIDEIPWDLSQSGRYKQNYGPKCNFKKRKVSCENFNGYPEFTRFIQERFKTIPLLDSFETVEQCSLDYNPERGSSIDPHIDDCWIWGERIPTLSMLSDSVLTLIRFHGPKSKYNLVDSESYPRIINEKGLPKKAYELEEKCHRLETTKIMNEDTDSGLPPTDNYKIEKDTAEISPLHAPQVIRIPMPRRSLLVLYGSARYEWEHCILREDIRERRVCITYRELTPSFLMYGLKADLGQQILLKAKNFWNHKTKNS